MTQVVTDRSCRLHLFSHTIFLKLRLCNGKAALFYQCMFVMLQHNCLTAHTACPVAVLGVSVMNGFCGMPHMLITFTVSQLTR